MRLIGEDSAREFVAERCTSVAIRKLESFITHLTQANQLQNLVSSLSLDKVWQRHIADSAQLLDHVSRETGVWVDLGSGAGLPGLIVAIMRPDRNVVLIESRRLRIGWLNDITDRLGLPNCAVIGCDVRSVGEIGAGVISARAFAPLSRLVALSARFSTNDTEWVLPKGRSAAQEIEMLPKDVRRLFHVEQSITDPEAGIVVGRGRVEAGS